MRTRIGVTIVFLIAVCCRGWVFAQTMVFEYTGYATYDSQPARMELTITPTGVTGWLEKDGECKPSIRLTETSLILTGTLTGQWEGSGSISGNWTGGDKVCENQLTIKEGYPQAGTFKISLVEGTVQLLRTGAPPLPTDWTYDFGPKEQTYSPAPVVAGGTKNPVSWWRAEGNANDSVGGAHGNLEDVTFAPGKVGQAFRFGGRNSSVRVPDTPDHDIANHWTLAAWVNTSSLSGHKGNGQAIISKVGGAQGNHGYQMGIVDHTGEIFLLFNEAGQTWPGWVLQAGKVPLNTWTFVAGTYDNNTMSIYVDGVLAGSRTIGARLGVDSSSNFRIGLDDNGNCEFSGMIDEARVYDRALEESEIRSLCPEEDEPSRTHNTISWWRAEGNANDSVGGAHGDLEDVTFAPGKFGQAFRFGGKNSSVRVSDAAIHDIKRHWTLAAWVNTSSLTGHKSNGQAIISKVGGAQGNHGYQMGIMDHSGEVFLLFNEAGQTWPGWVLQAGKVPLNTWTFIAGTYDNNTMSIYVDGALAGSRTIGPKLGVNSSSNFRIGLDDNGNCEFSGMIDEARVIGRALSGAEIGALYSGTGN